MLKIQEVKCEETKEDVRAKFPIDLVARYLNRRKIKRVNQGNNDNLREGKSYREEEGILFRDEVLKMDDTDEQWDGKVSKSLEMESLGVVEVKINGVQLPSEKNEGKGGHERSLVIWDLEMRMKGWEKSKANNTNYSSGELKKPRY
ncbi:MAG: hypothetical protein Ta2E_11850 [Mycoplasmoidaceae bacterium]|nr:MAG: hypothetical protein Ta2E_11850 [Mycoplasmoidaceae bacterium]